MKDLLVIPCQMQAPKWRSDDTATITLVSSQELSTEQFMVLSDWKKVTGFLAFKRNQFDPSDLPKGNAPGTKWDTNRAKRMRQKIYILHQQRNMEEDFEVYYEHQMAKFEQLIDNLLD